MKFSHFFLRLQEQHGQDATDSLKHQLGLNDENEIEDSVQLLIDPVFALETLSKMKTTAASNVRVRTKVDRISGIELVNYIQWFSSRPQQKHESYF